MKFVRSIIFVSFVGLYGLLFSVQEEKFQAQDAILELALPVSFQEIAAGYIKQLAAEMLFIRTSVFLGGVPPGTSPAIYADALANNFEVMTKLYPPFIDPYYFCQSFLTYISPELASKVNTILETGIAAHPEDITLRFFYGSNFFLSMNEPLKGSAAFADAAKLPGAPPMFGHLSALLSAKGGDIAAGLISLNAMLAVEKDEVVRARYQEEVMIFEQAMGVQSAINLYATKHGVAPQTLEQLVPGYILQIPEIKNSFTLVYDPPNLHLQRPNRTKKSEK